MSDPPVELDMRGQVCPRPLMETKRALDGLSQGVVRVRVDAEAARGNIVRAATAAGHEVSVQEGEGEWAISIRKEPLQIGRATFTPDAGAVDVHIHTTPAAERQLEPQTGGAGTAFLLAGKGLGRGDDELAGILTKAFLYTLTQREVLPRAVVMLNLGVRLVCRGSAVLEHLRTLQERGVLVIACGTCLDFFGWTDQVEVGVVSNMYEIVETLDAAGKVIGL